MDRIQISCPSCQAKLGVPTGRAGSVECPSCRSTFAADTRPKNPYADGRGWRRRLLRSLADTGVTRPQRTNRPIYLGLLLRGIPGAAVVVFLSWLTQVVLDNSSKTPWPFLADFFLVTSVVSGIITGALIVPGIRLRRQMRAVGAEQALAHSARRPVLYLRSFDMDELIGRQSLLDYLFHGSFRSDALGPEDQMAKRFSKLGPMIAIGRPGEDLPSLGAARFYVSDAKWQEKVADIARESQFVVWVSGKTAGLQWELSHLVESVAPEQLILWAHPHLLRLKATQRESEWRSFLDRLGDTFPIPLPSRLGETRLFYFEDTFVPQPIKPNEYALWSPQGDALRSLFAATGLLEAPAWTWRTPNRVVALLIGAVCAILISLSINYYIYHQRQNIFDNSLLYYLMHEMSYVTMLFNGLYGAAFVALLPRLARVRGGYRVGALLFAAILMLWTGFILPLTALLVGRPYWLSALVGQGDWFDLIVFINGLAVRALIWVVLLVFLLRFLPFAPGRPKRPMTDSSQRSAD